MIVPSFKVILPVCSPVTFLPSQVSSLLAGFTFRLVAFLPLSAETEEDTSNATARDATKNLIDFIVVLIKN
ncbi:hypothetical protein D3C87_1889730 [compost metagenome]